MSSYSVIVALMLLPAGAAYAVKDTDVGQETVWDQIMHGQSVREMQTGAEYMDSHDYDKATHEFAKAVLARPNDPDPHLMLGAAYYWSGQVETATAEFREALRLDPKNAQGHLLMGIVHAWKGDVPQAYQSFLEAEKYAPNRADVEMNLGSVEETLGQYPKAMDHLRKAVSLEPQNPLYHFQLGMLYSRLGRNSDAVEALKDALSRYPEFEDAALELGAAQERENRMMDAISNYSKAVNLKSRDSVARLRLGRAFLAMNNTTKAREIFRDAFHVTPDESGGGLALSVSFGGKPPESSAPSSSVPHPASRDQAPQPNDPLDVVKRNLERIPLDQDAKLKVQMAFSPRPKLVRSGPQEGASSLKQALEDANKAPKPSAMGVEREFNLHASNDAERAQQIQKVMADLREVMKQSPADAEVRMGMQLNYTPKTASAGGAGRTDSQTSPKVSYQPREVGNDLGLWVVGTGWMALVEETLPEEDMPSSHPNLPLWWVADGLAYAALGDGGRALESFNRALELDGKEETALLGRAVAFVEMGREAEAIDAYRRLLGVYPRNRTAKDGLAWLLRNPAAKK